MNHLDFYQLLLSFNLVEPIDFYLLSLIEKEIKDRSDKETLLIFFTMMLSLIDDGNACISLDKDTLLNKWNKKVNGKEVLFKEAETDNSNKFSEIRNQKETIVNALNIIDKEPLDTLIGKEHFFIKEDGYLYIKKYYDAKNSIVDSIKRLFTNTSYTYKYQDFLNAEGKLTSGQKDIVSKGLTNNLIVTGGPGTGKTTSVLFLLLNLLSNDIDHFVYLLAPSGKASSRMKESIAKSMAFVDEKKVDQAVLEKVKNLQESTIHRLLHIDPSTNKFTRNKNRQFSKNSIFIIDEASMIDICLFSSLLEAIPDEAKVFILGDYNQLPSVENGAVFADLVDMPYLRDNGFVSTLTEFVRFDKDSEVFKLASEINGSVPISQKDWRDPETFELLELDANNDKLKPVLFYENTSDPKKERSTISSMLIEWGNKFYKDLQTKASSIKETDADLLQDIYTYVDEAKILCAVNEGIRGTKTINNFIRKKFIDVKKPTSIFGYYPGELIMINKNNPILDLYNGDSGVLMTFDGDETLYFMIEKKSAITDVGSKKKDDIFALSVNNRIFTFYPLRMITEADFDLAYAITIHKSQGSDFKNIFVILPTLEGHPLLTKQIVYTAVTRSKGITYILSNQDRLLEAQANFDKRDTNIK